MNLVEKESINERFSYLVNMILCVCMRFSSIFHLYNPYKLPMGEWQNLYESISTFAASKSEILGIGTYLCGK